MSDQTEWHLDRRVPIALIAALLIKSATIIWWAAQISERVERNARAVAVLDSRQDASRMASQAQAVQLGRIEEQLGAARRDISRLITALERQQRDLSR